MYQLFVHRCWESFYLLFYKMKEKIVNPARPQARPQSNAPLIDLKQLWTLIIVNWYWIVASVLSCCLLAGLYLWFTPVTVTVTGKMEIIDKSKKNNGLSAGMSMLSSLPMGLGNAIGSSIGGSLGIEGEKEILSSNTLVRDVVKDLGIYTDYYLCNWGRKRLLYQDQPVNVSIDAAHLQWFDTELPLSFHQIQLTIKKDDDGYKVETMLKENKEKTHMPDQSFASLPAVIKTEFGTLTLTENILTEKKSKPYVNGYKLKVIILPPVEVANDFINRMAIEPPTKKVNNILNISLKDKNIIRGIDFVNHLVKAYNKRANDEKNEEAIKTDEFVNARLAKIDAELGSSDAAWENSKKNFQITDPEVDASEVVEKKSKYEAQLVEIGTQLQLHDYLSEYVHNVDNLYELIPVGITGGMGDLSGDANSKESSNSSLIAKHNTLVSQRKELLRSVSEKAPQVQRLTESIKELHPTLLTSLKRDRQNIILKRNAVEREYSKYMGRVNTAPKMERVLTEIGRQREIKQGVYLLMLQKREETAMELANISDKGRFIDDTAYNRGSEKPQKKIILLAAAFMGLLIPLIWLWLCLMIKSKIDTANDLKNVIKDPIIGEITLNNNEDSIRTLRSNILQNLKEGQKVVMLISESEGDGKTYLAKQLTDSLSAIGKKALYFNADLRSDKISTGKHPADILASEDFANQMIDARANNDYVIIDTPALGKYNDACQIASFADASIFVVKAGFTNKSAIEKLKSKTFPQLAYVLNAIDMTKKINQYLFK